MPPDPRQVHGARKAVQMPRFVPPQLATLVDGAPHGDDWSHEIKFDGYRALIRIENGVSEIRSRNDKDWTAAYRVLAEEAAKLPVKDAILDGEVVVRLPDGTTSFEALRHLARIPGWAGGQSEPGGTGEPWGTQGKLVYYAFDLLFLDGYELFEVPLEERTRLLRQLLEEADDADRIRFSDHIAGDGATVLAQACGLGLEGVVSKRKTSPYRPGVRGREWVKSKCRLEQEFVIGGFTDPAGTRAGFGALLLGVYTERGLRYVSKVGTGFDYEVLRTLGSRLRTLETDHSPFEVDAPRGGRGVHWVKPELVAEVSFLEWTSSGGIRHASFKGLREDKSALEVGVEKPARARRREESP